MICVRPAVGNADVRVLFADASLTVKSTGSLVLPNVSLKDEGQYSCTATNDMTMKTLESPYSISLRLADTRNPTAPRFLNSYQSTYSVQQGGVFPSIVKPSGTIAFLSGGDFNEHALSPVFGAIECPASDLHGCTV